MSETSRAIVLDDGRTIRINEGGKANGMPFLALRGSPQSQRLYHGWVEDALARGIRLITYERPGYGKSTAQPGRTVASAAQDVAAIARALGLRRLLIWGVSGGGPHTLACAALLPNLVAAAAVLASPAPYPAEGLDYFAGMGEMNVTETLAAISGKKEGARAIEKSAADLLCATPETIEQSFRTLLCPADVAALTTDFASFVVKSIREGIGESRGGWIDDEMAFVSPWGFELSQIRIPVLLLHGSQDRMVPFSHGQWLASKIPTAEPRLLAGDGHLTISLQRIPEVHEWLLNKL